MAENKISEAGRLVGEAIRALARAEAALEEQEAAVALARIRKRDAEDAWMRVVQGMEPTPEVTTGLLRVSVGRAHFYGSRAEAIEWLVEQGIDREKATRSVDGTEAAREGR